ncbi:MAG TPA: glycosyltransferase family 9 protein [Micromonosporaceae bacterium]|nr:glycosyltransferase family 9 protein [Micromonosporaceae bacterium]
MILALRALGVGDLATAVPALRGLRAAFPDRVVALAAPAWLAPLVDLIGGVDRLIPVDGLDPYDWPGPPPRIAVNLHGCGPQSHQLLRSAGPERLFAFACRAAGHHDGPRWIEKEHEVQRWGRLLRWYGVGVDTDDLWLRRPSPHQVPIGATIVHPGGKEARRRWSPTRFAAVAGELARLGHRVVVTGSAAERDLARQVVVRAGLPDAALLAGRLDLADLAALVGHGRLLVAADTGIGHLATAYGTPSVLLFGPVSPRRWGPPPDRPWHRVLWHERLAWLDETPPVDGDLLHPALAAIDVEAVLDAVVEAERQGRVGRVAAAAQ